MSVSDKLKALFEAKSNKNLEAGQIYLAENGKRPEVTTTDSGLQYEVIKMGDGVKPTAAQTVNCHYHGTTIEGVVFDSSVQRGKTIEFPLNRVIKGWTEGLQYMPVGSKFRFFIPADLAYGDQQISAEIGPNSTLLFEVELFGVR
jgi:FKBP-type peptidyl-prolyl cis-trans isomerase FklB